MGFEKFIFKSLFYLLLLSIGYLYYQILPPDTSFYPGYFVYLIIFLLIAFLDYFLHGNKAFEFLYFGNALFLFIGFYLPLPFIEGNELLRSFSNWNSNKDIFEVLNYINLGLVCVVSGFNLIRTISIPKIVSEIQHIKISKIYILFTIYLISIILLISTGNYGITQSLYNDSSNYITILTSGLQFGTYGLLILIFYHYDNKLLIFIAISVMFLLGLLSGLKEQALLPLMIFGVTYFFVFRKIPKKFILISLFLSFAAFFVVGSFRSVYLHNNARKSGIDDAGKLLSTYINSAQEGTKKKYNYYQMSTFEIAINRFNYVPAFRRVINYTNKEGFGVPYDSKVFHIVLSPFYAFLPRLILPFKPISNFGTYITSELYGYGKEAKYSIGVSQIGYSFMVGGITGIVVLMFLIGLFQGLLYKFFYHSLKPLYIFLFISNLYVPDVLWAYTTSMIRFSLIFLIILLLLRTRKVRLIDV